MKKSGDDVEIWTIDIRKMKVARYDAENFEIGIEERENGSCDVVSVAFSCLRYVLLVMECVILTA